MAMLSLIISFGLLILAITIHEFAHCFAADRLGDPTPRLKGRLTINPLAHLDPLGILLPLFLVLSGSSFVFGWGKPAPFDPFNLRNPKRDIMLIALAGPISNLGLAVLLSLALKIIAAPTLILLISSFIKLNIFLAIFNLLPIHPLDGSKILAGILPADWAKEYEGFMRDYGLFLLIFLIIPIGGSSIAINLILPIISWVTQLLL